MTDVPHYVAVFLTALLVTYVLTPCVRKFAARMGAVDIPDPRRPHTRPTPRGGGLAVVAGVQIASLLALGLKWATPGVELDVVWWRHFVLASSLVVALGIADDLYGLKPLVKLAGQAAAAGLIYASGVRFGNLLGIPLPPGLDAVLVICWIVGVINAFNLIDGLDGLASGLAIISAVGLTGVLILGHLPGELIVLTALIGACLGFLRYNFHPATVFLGDTGSMFLGFTLGVISLRTLTKDAFFLSFCIPLLVLGVPLFDEVLAIWRRSVRGWLTGKSGGIMQPDIDHLHHRLLKAGLSTRRVTAALCAINAGLVLCGLLITSFRSHAVGIFLIAFLAAVYVVMRQLAVIELRDTGRVILRGLHRPTHATFKALLYPAWDMAVLSGAVAVPMWILGVPRDEFWRSWFLDLPVWVTPTFLMLSISRTYITVWTRARPLDYMTLFLTLWAGLLLSLSIALLIDPGGLSSALLTALLIGTMSHPAIIFVRVLYRFVEEAVLYFRNRSETDAALAGIALYGAGFRCQLYLKERGSARSTGFDGRPVIGLIDDEPSLTGQWVYGYEVLGDLMRLPAIVARYRISEIIITANLDSENAGILEQIAKDHHLKLSEWSYGMRDWSGVSETPVKQDLPKDTNETIGARRSERKGAFSGH